jgi:hypothetical protein
MPLQQQRELPGRIHFRVMFFLARNVPNDARQLRPADAAREIPFLPFKPGAQMFIHPSRGIGLQDLHGLRDAQGCSEIDEGVDMIVDPADRNSMHAMVLRDSGEIGPQFRLEAFVNRFVPVFRAEDDVDVVADVRVGHLCRPSGTRLLLLTLAPALPCRATDCTVPSGLRSSLIYVAHVPLQFSETRKEDDVRRQTRETKQSKDIRKGRTSESRRDETNCSPARECRVGKIKKKGVSPGGTAQIPLQPSKSEKDDTRRNRLR